MSLGKSSHFQTRLHNKMLWAGWCDLPRLSQMWRMALSGWRNESGSLWEQWQKGTIEKLVSSGDVEAHGGCVLVMMMGKVLNRNFSISAACTVRNSHSYVRPVCEHASALGGWTLAFCSCVLQLRLECARMTPLLFSQLVVIILQDCSLVCT